MQIERLHHLQFPSDSKLAAEDSDKPSVAGAPPLPVLPISSAVVRIQSEPIADQAAQVQPAKVPATTVYSDARRVVNVSTDEQDTQRMAQDYQRAVERSTSAPAVLSVDKDGVMVARKSSESAAPAPDFMTAAVKTMRDYANEAERLKNIRSSTEGASTGLGGSALRGLQHLTSKFKLFA